MGILFLHRAGFAARCTVRKSPLTGFSLAASAVAEDVLAAVERPERYPYSGRTGTRELAIPGRPYVVVYQIDRGAVSIVRLLHGAQLWPPVRDVTGLAKSIALNGRAFNIACGQIDIGNAATAMTMRMTAGGRKRS